jgi:hypothetical protein
MSLVLLGMEEKTGASRGDIERRRARRCRAIAANKFRETERERETERVEGER